MLAEPAIDLQTPEAQRRRAPGLHLRHAARWRTRSSARPTRGLTRGNASGKTVTGSLRFAETRAPARNVVAILPGTDPRAQGRVRRDRRAQRSHRLQPRPGRSRFAARVQHRRASGRRGRCAAHADGRRERRGFARFSTACARIHPPRRDSIYNGADDDGSGTVAVLEIAESLVNAPRQAEALDPLRLARRRGGGTLGLGVLHRSSDRAARFDRARSSTWT